MQIVYDRGGIRLHRPGVEGIVEVKKLRLSGRSKEMKIGGIPFDIGSRTFIMGILNVTPDSFSDGGEYLSLDTAVRHALEMERMGADIIDVGGESTRPGHRPVAKEEEISRTIPVIRELFGKLRVPISIDTSKADVARAALEAGASLVNDVWGLKRDPAIATLAAEKSVPVCLMHNREDTNYGDLMDDILSQLKDSVRNALLAGIEAERIILDPGIGFGKTPEQNIELMGALERMSETGFPWLLGTSRKSLIGKNLELPISQRLEATIATNVLGIRAGADFIRVHDVLENTRAARMTDLIMRSSKQKRVAGEVKNIVHIAIGSNLGDRLKNLREATAAVSKIRGTELLALSGIYETEPMGPVKQGKFLNGALKISSSLEPEDLLRELNGIEQSLGRERNIKWGPRTIDLDILFYNDIIMKGEGLTIPHPRLQDRLFVLRPLMDIDPLHANPVNRMRVLDMLDRLIEKEGGGGVEFFAKLDL